MPLDKEPYQDVFIRDIQSSHSKIVVSGTVIQKTDTHFSLDDGTGTLSVTGKQPPSDFVRVFGMLTYSGETPELQAHLIQDYSGVDKELLRRVKKLMHTIP